MPFRGKKRPYLCKPRSQSTKDKISKAVKIAYSNKENHPWFGRKHSQQTKEKMSMHNAWRGKHIPKEIIEKGRKTQQLTSKFNKPILQYDKDGNFIKEHISISAAYREILELTGKKINITVCIKRNGLGAGFIWIYKTCDNISLHIDTSKYIRNRNKN